MRNEVKRSHNAAVSSDSLDSPVNHYQYEPLQAVNNSEGSQGLSLTVVLMVFVKQLAY